jgi:hypothetical protein
MATSAWSGDGFMSDPLDPDVQAQEISDELQTAPD